MIRTQGESTTARVDLLVSNRQKRCRLEAKTVVTIEHMGVRARVVGNPFKATLERGLSTGTTDVLRLDWTNWCGQRTGIRVRATAGPLVAISALRPIPLCLQRRDPSKLLRVS